MVFSFSTKSLDDEKILRELKFKCNVEGLNFSQFVITAIKEALNDQRRTKNKS